MVLAVSMMNRFISYILIMACASVSNWVSSEEFNLDDDLLMEDEFSMDEIDGLGDADVTSSWWDGFVTSLEHSQTHIEEGRQYQRSNGRLQYDYAVAEGWFISLDYKHSYYWQDDAQAQQQDEVYNRGRWQQAWVQYSKGSCAYKVGKQTLLWGNVEGTFAVDVVTPFDYTEQLLTDYNSVRLAQNMIVSDCFLPQVQTQLFYIPEARLDLRSHRAQPFNSDSEEEFGGLIKFNWEGGDVSFMAARLYGNQPVPVFGEFNIPGWENQMFDFFGISSSVAFSRLLLKTDLGLKKDQIVEWTGEEHDVLEFAAGFEYTTATNHSLNGGFWVIKDLEEDHSDPESRSQSPLYTFGWSKSYWNDDLSMSLLGNITTDPELYSFTVLAQYQFDDYWQFSAALGLSELKDDLAAGLPVPPDESITLQAKYQF